MKLFNFLFNFSQLGKCTGQCSMLFCITCKKEIEKKRKKIYKNITLCGMLFKKIAQALKGRC